MRRRARGFTRSAPGPGGVRARRRKSRPRNVRDQPVRRRGGHRRAECQPQRTDEAPYEAAVTFQKVFYTPGTRAERARETYGSQLDFVIRGRVPHELVRVSPLRLEITYFRVNQAFEEPHR